MSIQRIQSLFLLCTAIINGLLFIMPVAIISMPDNLLCEYYTTKVVQAGSPPVFITWNWYSMILTTLITILAFVTIFAHKRKTKTVRPTLFLQLRLCIVNIILQLGLMILVWLQLRGSLGEDATWNANLSAVFPFVGMIFTWLALRGIIKDIALLKSFDRIR